MEDVGDELGCAVVGDGADYVALDLDWLVLLVYYIYGTWVYRVGRYVDIVGR